MQDIYNGMPAADLEGAVWRKSRRSNSQGACVEMSRIDGETIAVRNSRDPEGPALVYSRDAIATLISSLRNGEFDSLLS